jgi:prefoldin subunit 5
MKTKLLILGLSMLTLSSFSQSKRELREKVRVLEEDKTELQTQLESLDKEKETLSTKLNRISNLDIDDVITPEEQPKDIIVGESGWRIELNGLKYKNDLIGQLGTVWILDSNGQIQPQGGFTLSDFDIEPQLISQDKEIIYKKFISNGTSMQGDGGASFVNITAELSQDQFSNFTINIEGTSQIIPDPEDLPSMANKVKHLFDVPNQEGIFVCTGMHVVKYNSVIFSKSDGEAKITSPVVNIGGEFYAESSEESSEYLVVRQLSRLYEPSGIKEEKIEKKLEAISKLSNTEKVTAKSNQFRPQEILKFLLKREPTFEELTAFESNPDSFIQSSTIRLETMSIGDKIILESAKNQIISLPLELKSVERME